MLTSCISWLTLEGLETLRVVSPCLLHSASHVGSASPVHAQVAGCLLRPGAARPARAPQAGGVLALETAQRRAGVAGQVVGEGRVGGRHRGGVEGRHARRQQGRAVDVGRRHVERPARVGGGWEGRGREGGEAMVRPRGGDVVRRGAGEGRVEVLRLGREAVGQLVRGIRHGAD